MIQIIALSRPNKLPTKYGDLHQCLGIRARANGNLLQIPTDPERKTLLTDIRSEPLQITCK
jgi:hypothetical protein